MKGIHKKIITRKLICNQIDRLLKDQLSIDKFGESMFDYLSLENDRYQFEKGYESIIDKSLRDFMDLHDVGKRNLNYKPYIPSRKRLIQIKNQLAKTRNR